MKARSVFFIGFLIEVGLRKRVVIKQGANALVQLLIDTSISCIY